jgi:DNA-binding XRE family transcriptional regulator
MMPSPPLRCELRRIILPCTPLNRGEKKGLEKLRAMRIDRGLSQRQLALKAGPSAGAVAAVEQRGRAHPETLKKIADVLGVRASELVRE